MAWSHERVTELSGPFNCSAGTFNGWSTSENLFLDISGVYLCCMNMLLIPCETSCLSLQTIKLHNVESVLTGKKVKDGLFSKTL